MWSNGANIGPIGPLIPNLAACTTCHFNGEEVAGIWTPCNYFNSDPTIGSPFTLLPPAPLLIHVCPTCVWPGNFVFRYSFPTPHFPSLPGTYTPGVREKRWQIFKDSSLGTGILRLACAKNHRENSSYSRRSICVQIVFKRLDDVSCEIDNKRSSIFVFLDSWAI